MQAELQHPIHSQNGKEMLILQNVEAQEAVNRKLRDMGLGDVSLTDD